MRTKSKCTHVALKMENVGLRLIDVILGLSIIVNVVSKYRILK